MGLTHIEEEMQAEDDATPNVRCTVTLAYLKLLELDPEAAEDLRRFLEPDSGRQSPWIAKVVNRRFAELDVKGMDLKAGPVNNHRREGDTCAPYFARIARQQAARAGGATRGAL